MAFSRADPKLRNRLIMTIRGTHMPYCQVAAVMRDTGLRGMWLALQNLVNISLMELAEGVKY